jgi:hypothetical protein
VTKVQARKAEAIMELVSGYEVYADASELSVDATADAPDSTAPCASFAISWVSGRFVSKTIVEGC